jgi:Recombinase
MARRRQRRRREKELRHAPRPATSPAAADGDVVAAVDRLVYSREQAAQALGVSLATLDRRVVPVIATVKTEWGARLIPAAELERYLAERTEKPRRSRRVAGSGRRSALPPEIVERIVQEHARGVSLAEIARRLNRDDIPTGQGGRQWWPSTVRAVVGSSSPRSPETASA